jgi:alcohol dehydrogenase
MHQIILNVADFSSAYSKSDKKYFVVSGSSSYYGSFREEFVKKIAGDEYSHFCTFRTGPQIEDIEIGYQQFKNINPDMVLAIGGGGAIDMAKNILWLNNRELNQKNTPLQNGPNFIACPTTASSGAEATSFAVSFSGPNKNSLEHWSLLPKIVILDPGMLDGIEKKARARYAIDSLVQLVEACWSVKSTKKVQERALSFIRTHSHFYESYVNSDDDQSRRMMQNTAYGSGTCINETKTTAVHALSYTLTTDYEVAHGPAVAMLLPLIVDYNVFNTTKYSLGKYGWEYHRDLLGKISDALGVDSYLNLSKHLRNLNERVGLLSLSQTAEKNNISTKALVRRLFENVNKQRMDNHPCKITLERLFDACEIQ